MSIGTQLTVAISSGSLDESLLPKLEQSSAEALGLLLTQQLHPSKLKIENEKQLSVLFKYLEVIEAKTLKVAAWHELIIQSLKSKFVVVVDGATPLITSIMQHDDSMRSLVFERYLKNLRDVEKDILIKYYQAQPKPFFNFIASYLGGNNQKHIVGTLTILANIVYLRGSHIHEIADTPTLDCLLTLLVTTESHTISVATLTTLVMTIPAILSDMPRVLPTMLKGMTKVLSTRDTAIVLLKHLYSFFPCNTLAFLNAEASHNSELKAQLPIALSNLRVSELLLKNNTNYELSTERWHGIKVNDLIPDTIFDVEMVAQELNMLPSTQPNSPPQPSLRLSVSAEVDPIEPASETVYEDPINILRFELRLEKFSREKLQRRLSRFHSQHNVELQSEQEIQGLKYQLEQQQGALENLTKQTAKKEADLKELRDQSKRMIQNYSYQLNVEKQSNEEARDLINVLTLDKEELQTLLKECRTQLEASLQSNLYQSSRLEEWREDYEDIQGAMKRLHGLKEEVALWEEQEHQLSEARNYVQDLQAQLRKKDTHVQQLHSAIQILKANKSELQEHIEDAEQNMKGLRAENEELRMVALTHKNQAETNQVVAASKIRSTESKYDQLKKINLSLQKAVFEAKLELEKCLESKNKSSHPTTSSAPIAMGTKRFE